MKLSDIQEYLEYGRYYARDDFDHARKSLMNCLKIKSISECPEQRSYLLMLIGNTHFDQHRKRLSIKYYRKALESDPESLMPKYLFAKFLFERVKDAAASLALCEEIIQVSLDDPLPVTEHDLSTEEYHTLAEELKNNILGKSRQVSEKT